jgi:UDP-4-amino-4-deoxy-L-arabinose formyltransferase/UDP-glucuronic acid dehydrogenase (UDP-4-keto-hexauronic acid decarboxylating)
VARRVGDAAVTVLARTWPKLKAGTAPRVPPDLAKGSYFGGRTPEDGRIDWTQNAKEIHDLVRAVTKPWPGAFTDLFGPNVHRRTPVEICGTTPSLQDRDHGLGDVTRRRPACQILFARPDGGDLDPRLCDWLSGGLTCGSSSRRQRLHRNALTRRILTTTAWEVFGPDVGSDNRGLPEKRFRFLEGDIAINREWIEYHVKKADVVLPLVAIATPAAYVKAPLSVFELDFEENLRIVKMAGKYGARVVFPSTSEVYGMCPDSEFDEDSSPLVYGPIRKERWIYSASKQLLDRVIWAMGHAQGLKFTLFRPFNWYGPHLDDVDEPKEAEPGPDAVPLRHPLRQADQARRRQHQQRLASCTSRTASMGDGSRERGREGRRGNLQHREPEGRPLDPRPRPPAHRGRGALPEVRAAGEEGEDRPVSARFTGELQDITTGVADPEGRGFSRKLRPTAEFRTST